MKMKSTSCTLLVVAALYLAISGCADQSASTTSSDDSSEGRGSLVDETKPASETKSERATAELSTNRKSNSQGDEVAGEPVDGIGSEDGAAILLKCAKHIEGDRDRDAVDLLLQLVEREPDNANAHMLLGVAYQNLQQFEQAAAAHKQAIAADPKRSDAYTNLGVALASQDKTEEAVVQFQRAVELNPNDTGAYNSLGIALQEVGRFEEAVEQHRAALAINNNWAKAHWNLGNALRKLGRREEAESQFRDALRIDPDYKAAHKNLGLTLAEMGQLESALPHMRKGMSENSVSFAMANALLGFKRYEEALPYYNKVLSAKPQHAKTHRNLGQALAALGRLDEAVVHQQQAVRLMPRDLQSQISLATTLEQLKRYDAAVLHWQQALNLDAQNVQVMNNLAWLLATCSEERNRDGKQAVELATRAALGSDYKSAFVLGTLAAAHAEAGNFKKAVDWQKKAIALAPDEHVVDFRRRLQQYEAEKPFHQESAKVGTPE